jgi:hypothetical protein
MSGTIAALAAEKFEQRAVQGTRKKLNFYET